MRTMYTSQRTWSFVERTTPMWTSSCMQCSGRLSPYEKVERWSEVTSLPEAEREEYLVQAGVLYRGVKFELLPDRRVKASHPHIRCSSKLKVNSYIWVRTANREDQHGFEGGYMHIEWVYKGGFQARINNKFPVADVADECAVEVCDDWCETWAAYHHVCTFARDTNHVLHKVIVGDPAASKDSIDISVDRPRTWLLKQTCRRRQRS